MVEFGSTQKVYFLLSFENLQLSASCGWLCFHYCFIWGFVVSFVYETRFHDLVLACQEVTETHLPLPL